jgi:hypothetical protein
LEDIDWQGYEEARPAKGDIMELLPVENTVAKK